MGKHFKLRISRLLTSTFQSCRSKDPSKLPENPVPVFFRPFPPNSEGVDVDFRGKENFQDCRLSKSHPKRHVSSAIVSVDCGFLSGPSKHDVTSHGDTKSPEFKWKKEEKWHVVARANDDAPRRKIYNSTARGRSYGDGSQLPSPTNERKEEKKKKNSHRNNNKRPKPKVRASNSSADTGWFSSEGGDDEQEMETLVSSSISFSTDWSFEHNPKLETIREAAPIDSDVRRKKKNLKKVRKVKRYASKGSIGAAATGKTVTCTSPEIPSPARLSVFRRLMPCMVDGKMRESFAVVKKSEDPYGDFKRSMLEMILEKQMFESKELEQLLQCFLSLNSAHHHPAIVQAFSEIWLALFCKTPMNQCLSRGAL